MRPHDVGVLVALALLVAQGQPSKPSKQGWKPRIAPATAEAELAMARFDIPEGFELELFAAEPQVANPVCLYVDHGGDVFVAETFRFAGAAPHVADNPRWIDDDVAIGRVSDRLGFLRGDRNRRVFDLASERVRWLRDADGDGRADVDIVFAEGFSGAATGVGSGLLPYGDGLLYGCVPDLWLLRDEDGNRRSDSRQLLSTGYGVHIGYAGHGVHGLRIGPDGKLYFSVGDRGFHVETENGTVARPDTGAVLRCNLDGTGLEVFATGLRNPQELVFNEYGDLFTVDNNADRGDRSRVVHLLEGADSGWRYPYQWLEQEGRPWNEESLWELQHEGQAAYILPPIGHLAVGPSGLTYDPGTGLPEAYRGHFFVCDYANEPLNSGIYAFTLEPRGAGFRLASEEQFVWKLLATDCDFGPDGTLYFSDWVEDRDQPGKGRIYRLFDPDSTAPQTAALLRGGMADRDREQLFELLSHPDRRVRQEVQLEVVRRNEGPALAGAAAGSGPRLGRIHAIWGLGMLRDPRSVQHLTPLASDADPEIRFQTARVLGWLARGLPAGSEGRALLDALLRLVVDPVPRVRLGAALALGETASSEAVDSLLDLLRADGADPALRHAAVMGLSRCASTGRLTAVKDEPLQVRLAAVVALRRMADPALAEFLDDEDGLVVLEAARAIYDLPVPEALPELAALINRERPLEYRLGRRVVQACLRVRGEAGARDLLRFALRADQLERLRVSAVEAVGSWSEPGGRDPVTGRWRELPPMEGDHLAGWVEQLLVDPGPGLQPVDEAPASVFTAWAHLLGGLSVPAAESLLAQQALDRGRSAAASLAALEALARLESDRLEEVVEEALLDTRAKLRARSLDLLGDVFPERALPLLERVARSGEVAERRMAYRRLGPLDPSRAEQLLASQLEELSSGRLPPELALDLVMAAESLGSKRLERLLEERGAQSPDAGSPQLEPFLDGLVGGASQRGRKLFLERADLECVRCHGVPEEEANAGFVRAGPDLRGLGARSTRRSILESIVVPSREIAPEYKTTEFWLTDGTRVGGQILEEREDLIRVRSAEGVVEELRSQDIEWRRDSASAMPEGYGRLLLRTQMRDLIEYLSGL